MKNISGKFIQELTAAGVSCEGVSWNSSGDIFFREDVPQQRRDAVLAVYAVHDPLAPDPDVVRLTAIDDAIKQDSVIALIKGQTSAEYDAWWAANVTNAAQAIGVLKRVVRILCRRVL